MKYWLVVAAIPVATFGVAACGDAEEASVQPAVEVAAAEEAQAVAEEAQEQVAELEKELEEQEEQANSEPPAGARDCARAGAGARDCVGAGARRGA